MKILIILLCVFFVFMLLSIAFACMFIANKIDEITENSQEFCDDNEDMII